MTARKSLILQFEISKGIKLTGNVCFITDVTKLEMLLMSKKKILNYFLIFIISIFTFNASALENCKWNNKKGVPCLTISKTPNSSIYSEIGINKQIITKQDIIDSGAIDSNDILNLVSKHNSLRPKLVIGFSAETDNLEKNSMIKLNEKNCDWIIANDVSKKDIGFDSDFNEVSIFYKNRKSEIIPKMKKALLANEIVEKINQELN